MSPSGRKWLDTAGQQAGEDRHEGPAHLQQRADEPGGYGSPEEDARRKAGVEMAKRWLEGCAVLGVKSMRMNSPQALGPEHPAERDRARPGDGYPRNIDIVPLLDAAIESYKEMADYGGNLGIRVTFENHWGLAADPMNIRIMIDAVNHPVLRSVAGLLQLGARVHAVQRPQGARAVLAHQRAREVLGSLGRQERRAALDAHHARRRLQGHVRARVRAGPLNGVEGAKYLYKEVLAALTALKTA